MMHSPHLSRVTFAATIAALVSCAEATMDAPAEEASTWTFSSGLVGADGRLVTPGSVGGVVHWNQRTLHASRLTIGLLDGPTLAANLVASSTDDAPTFPYEFDFQDVPDGKYWVFSFMDIGEPNDVSAPGQGDRLVITEGDVFILRAELPPPPAVLELQ